MSAWEVYLIMQSSNIAIGTLFVSIVFFVAAGLIAMAIDTNYRNELKDFSSPKRLVKIGAVVFLVSALIPSRETIAAMYIVPKLTSKEFIEPATKEAKELYEIFKESLRNRHD